MSWLQSCQHFHYNSALFMELKLTIKMMCAGMKLGTWYSQSGSPFLNLILQNWKTLSHLKFMEGSPFCAWYMVWMGLTLRPWGDRMKSGKAPQCIFWLPLLSGLSSPWVTEMVSKAAMSENWHQVADWDMINSYRKNLSSLFPICQLDPRRLWGEDKQL